MAVIKGKARQTSSIEQVSEGAEQFARMMRDGSLTVQNWLLSKVRQGKVFCANGGSATTPATFAGAYDADAPDLYVYVPYGTTITPVYLMVKYEAVGTESEMEVIALASNTGDSSATVTGGAAITIRNMRADNPFASLCTASYGVDAAGITDPNAGNYVEFWRRGHPLKDTSATGENDRNEQVYEWNAGSGLVPPTIVGAAASGSCLAVYAASQAGTGFITAIWVEEASGDVV